MYEMRITFCLQYQSGTNCMQNYQKKNISMLLNVYAETSVEATTEKF